VGSQESEGSQNSACRTAATANTGYPCFRLDPGPGPAEVCREPESDWSHEKELDLLKEDMLEAAKLQRSASFRTFNMNAFEPEPNKDKAEEEEGVQRVDPAALAIPTNFPPHHTVDGAIELSTYLASSSYIVSLGGPPLADLKYGTIIVPSGEEELLFTGYGDHAAIPDEMKAEIYAKSKAMDDEEWRKKIDREMADGVSSTPALDDDDRAFYRRRWLARKGIVEDPETAESMSDKSNEPQIQEGSSSAAVDNISHPSAGEKQPSSTPNKPTSPVLRPDRQETISPSSKHRPRRIYQVVRSKCHGCSST